MARDREERQEPALAAPLAELADRLLELEQATDGGQRQLRRLRSRLQMANQHRRRLLTLTAALLQQRFRDTLRDLGADTFDIARAEVDTPYDGLLVALAAGAGDSVRRILLVGAAAEAGRPEFAADLLAMPIEVLPDASGDATTAAGDTAVVVTADALLQNPTLQAALIGRAAVFIVLLGTFDAQEAPRLRERARHIMESLEAGGFEAVHVGGAGELIAFARRGLVEGGRAESFTCEPRQQDG